MLVSLVPLSCEGSSVDSGETHGSGGAGRGGSAGKGGATGVSGGASGATGASGGASGTAARGGSFSGGNGGRGGAATGGSSNAGKGGNAGGNPGGAGGSEAAGDGGEQSVAGEGGEGGALSDAVTWDIQGNISANTNDFGIRGRWFLKTDCADAAPASIPCTSPNPSLMGPDAQLGWTVDSTRVCAKGVATQVIMENYDLEWGVRLGFELNRSRPYDADARGIRGFAFDIVSQAIPAQPATLLVAYSTASTVKNPHFVTVTLPSQDRTVLFDDALQGSWVTTVVPLDTTELTSVDFWVFTSIAAPKPYDFCVSNVRVLR